MLEGESSMQQGREQCPGENARQRAGMAAPHRQQCPLGAAVQGQECLGGAQHASKA